MFQASKARRASLELTEGRAPLAWPARTGPMDRRASWGASDLLAARGTPGVGALTATWETQAALGSPETKVPRGMLAAQDAEGHQAMTGPRGARVTKATMEPQEVPVSKGPKAGLGPEARRASPGAGETPEPRAAQAARAPKARRGTLAQRGPGAWQGRSAAKEPRETEACLDPEVPRGLLGSPGSRGLGATLVMLGHVETPDSLAPRETPAGLDSATQDPEEHRERKASRARRAPREAEAILG